MARYDAATASCDIYSFKEGLLSAVAHDLRLRAGGLVIEVSPEGQVVATVDARTIRVEAHMKNGKETGRPSAADSREIEVNLRDKVLDVGRYPEIVFRSTAQVTRPSGRTFTGTLSLHGQVRPLTVTTEITAAGETAILTIDHTEFGILQFRALLGSLRVQTTVRVVVHVPTH